MLRRRTVKRSPPRRVLGLANAIADPGRLEREDPKTAETEEVQW